MSFSFNLVFVKIWIYLSHAITNQSQRAANLLHLSNQFDLYPKTRFDCPHTQMHTQTRTHTRTHTRTRIHRRLLRFSFVDFFSNNVSFSINALWQMQFDRFKMWVWTHWNELVVNVESKHEMFICEKWCFT